MDSAGLVNEPALVADLADRGRPARTEADVQSSLKSLLLAAPPNGSELP